MAWTDERLDDLARLVDAGFTEVRADIRALSAEMRAGDAAAREATQAMGASLRQEMQAGQTALRAEMQAGDAALGEEIRQLRAVVMRFGTAITLAALAMLVAILTGSSPG